MPIVSVQIIRIRSFIINVSLTDGKRCGRLRLCVALHPLTPTRRPTTRPWPFPPIHFTSSVYWSRVRFHCELAYNVQHYAAPLLYCVTSLVETQHVMSFCTARLAWISPCEQQTEHHSSCGIADAYDNILLIKRNYAMFCINTFLFKYSIMQIIVAISLLVFHIYFYLI